MQGLNLSTIVGNYKERIPMPMDYGYQVLSCSNNGGPGSGGGDGGGNRLTLSRIYYAPLKRFYQ